MNDVVHNVEERINVVDQATGPLGKIAAEAEKTRKRFEGIKAMVGGAFGLFTGGLIVEKLKETVHETERYLKHIKEVSELTGATAEQTDFMFSSARKAGIEYDSMQRIMFMMSKRGATMENSMAVSATGGKTMQKTMARMGVDMRQGPVVAMMQLSKQVRRGKIGAEQLMSQFRVPAGQVNDFKEFLEGLTEAKMQKAIVGGGLVTAFDIKQFDRLEKAQHRLADSWNRIKVMTGKELIPMLADMTGRLSSWLEQDFLPKARQAGEFLRDHMHEVLGAAKKLSAYVGANKVLQMFFGTSVRGAAGAVGGMVGGGAMAGLGVIGAGLYVAAQAFKTIQANVDGVKDRLLNLWLNIKARVSLVTDDVNALWERISSIFGVDSDFSKFIGSVASMGIEKLVQGIDFFLHIVNTVPGFVGDMVGLVKNAFTFFTKAVYDSLIGIVKGMNDTTIIIGIMMLRPFEGLFKVLSAMPGIGGAAMEVMGAAFGSIVEGQKNQLKQIGEAFIMPLRLGANVVAGVWEKNWDRTGQQAMLKRYQQFETGRIDSLRDQRERDATETDKKPPSNLFDFRGSRFDITQNFAEGFDPDRVAVAFTQDLADLGETKVQSQGFVPLYSMR